MKRARRPLATLALVALISLIGAGCGSSAPSETGTASSSGSSPAASAARKQGLRFAQCMRDNGVSAFPDPDASGELTIDAIANGSALDPSTPAFEKAMSACKDLQPAGFTGRRRSSPTASATTACRTSRTPPPVSPSSTRTGSRPLIGPAA